MIHVASIAKNRNVISIDLLLINGLKKFYHKSLVAHASWYLHREIFSVNLINIKKC
jgi:hypothetical protein